MIRIADQYGLRGEEPGTNHLADDTLGGNECLAIVDAIAAAHVDNEVVLIRIRIDGHDPGNAYLVAYPRASIEHGAQTRILGLQGRQPLQPDIGDQPFAAQPTDLALQLVTGRRRFTQPLPEPYWRIDNESNRVDGDADAFTHRIEVVFPVIEVHQHDADDDKDDNPRTECRNTRWIAVISPGRDHLSVAACRYSTRPTIIPGRISRDPVRRSAR